jgi:hypothetical protein
MQIVALIKLLLALAPILDYERPVRQPIPRSEKVATVIATAAFETDDPVHYAVWLDVLGAHESGYNPSLSGDHTGTGVSRSCGTWQTPCERTPGFARCEENEEGCHWGWAFHGTRTTALEQARVAISVLRTSVGNCPEHVIWRYASGQCAQTRTAALYEVDVNAELAQMTSSEETALLSP